MLITLVAAMGAAAVAAMQAPSVQDPDPGVQGVPAVLPGTPVSLPEAPPDILWSVPLTAAPVGSPLVAGDHVLIAHLPGIIAAHRMRDGQLVWQTELQPEQPLVADAGVLFVAAVEAIHAVRIADGAVAWRAPVGTLSAPLLAEAGWVIAAGAGKLTARRGSDGTAVWAVDAPVQRHAAVISGNTLIVPGADGWLRMRDLATGAVIWERRLGGAPGEPLVVGETIFVGASDHYFYRLRAGSGEIDWKIRVGAPILGRASSDGERVFFTARDNVVRAADIGHGHLRWQTPLTFRPLAGPVAAGGTVFVSGSATDFRSDSVSQVRMLRAADGSAAGSVTVPAKLAVAPGVVRSDFGVAIAAVTGGLNESWNLLLTRAVRATPITGARPR